MMNRIFRIVILILVVAITTSVAKADNFRAGTGTFLLNDEPFIIKAAELHYPRIPRPYWDQRIKQCKALGMNTICLYVFWNAHEEQEGEFDFTGNNDLRHFIHLCEENDMKVILRPGPYVCAEWEMGGLPWWLLKKKDIRLREDDPYFLEKVDRFEKAVAEQVADLTIDKGGPIIMVQVENEYGSYGTNRPYVASIRDMLRKYYGRDVAMFQCDWESNFTQNGLPDLLWTMNFGTGADIDQQFAALKRLRPDSPLMCSEFWSGWFDKWGAGHETRPADDMIAGIDEMLSKNISFSLYMTHGGTNWGHWAGANSPGFAPDVTSYDYDAPISESGQLTPKYHKLRTLLAKYSDSPLPEIPASIPSDTIAEFRFTEYAPLFKNNPTAITDSIIRPMEDYGQGYGSILYRTELSPMETASMEATLPSVAKETSTMEATLPSVAKETSTMETTLPGVVKDDLVLTLYEPHDYAQVFLNGEFLGSIDRRLGQTSIPLPTHDRGDILEILVEGMGRINFGRAIKDYKGITEDVVLTRNGEKCYDFPFWEVELFPDTEEFYKSLHYEEIETAGRADGRLPRGVYRGTFTASSTADTFLDFSSWGKGLVYVNGHPLGRIWEIGPQQTLYMPGCWLREGENEILVFDILGPKEAVSRGLAEPLLDDLRLEPIADSALSQKPKDEEIALIYEGEFAPGNGWQERRFDASPECGFVYLEIEDAADGAENVSIAEIYFLDEKGERIPREDWHVGYVSSEDFNGNHTADKAFDLQESTYWRSAEGTSLPQQLLIDLGGVYRVSGIQCLPRMQSGAPESPRRFRLSSY